MSRHKHDIHDIVLNCMKADGDVPMTVDYYCRSNYSLTWEEIQNEYPEWEAEVRDLIEDGELFDGENGEYRLAIEESD